ncbi:RNA-binding S4 domain-containing protein [Sneathiella limimaris]|uniref:RNA-binding S4 domain-containing protein n=1 Tax=Sneathiella limimaris TaxID=1964213 RepID=UPI00146A65A9|nr:RNA-binding S4 domain-containing protein [Sneathiella limimaris]
MAEADQNPQATIRVDRWLWFARFFKSRSLAAKMVQSKKVRINSVVVSKPSVTVKVDDVLTFQQAKEIRVVKILKIGERRGPAPEAQTLYEDLAPVDQKKTDEKKKAASKTFIREPGSGRPTKADRRALDKLKKLTEE